MASGGPLPFTDVPSPPLPAQQLVQGGGKLLSFGGQPYWQDTSGTLWALTSAGAEAVAWAPGGGDGRYLPLSGGTVTGQFSRTAFNWWSLDSFTGTDDQKMTSAIAQVVSAGGGTIELEARAHTFANQWSTSYSSGVVVPLRIIGAGAAGNDLAAPNTGAATTVSLSYSGAGAARMDFQHIGSIEITGILFKDSGGSSVPFFQTTNATPVIHDNTFSGSATGTACFQDAIVLGGTGSTVGAGDAAPYQGYQGRIYGNTFNGIRRMVLLQTYANSVEIHENLVTGLCGSNLQLGACVEFSSTLAAITGCHVWGNCVEMTHYPCFVKGTSGCTLNVLGPNGLFDATATTLGYYIFLANAAQGNSFNQVLDHIRTDTYPLVLDFAGQNSYQTFHQTQASYVAQPQIFANVNRFLTGYDNYFHDQYGDYAAISPVLDAANAGGYATIALAEGNCTQTSDGQSYLGSNWISSATAAFVSTDIGAPITMTGFVAYGTVIQQVAGPTTAPPWFTSGTYALGDIARPTSANSHLYQCTTAGTASATQPTWPTGGGTVPDGSVVWQDLGTAATAALTNKPAASTNSAATLRWGRNAATNTYLKLQRFHLQTQGSAPSTTADAGAGSSPTGITTTGTDHAFIVSITTGGSGTAAGDMFHTVSATTWSSTPKFAITAGNSATAALLLAGGYYYTFSGSTFTFYVVNAPVISTAYVFDIIAMS
jgi:hypothetical protein